MEHITLITDGACRGNPGPGGWAAILVFGKTKKELCGKKSHTTNNEMELTAVIEGLKALKRKCKVTVKSDSKYIVNAFAEGWLDNWIRKGWRTAGGKPVANQALWQELAKLVNEHDVDFRWVKGHAGDPLNERADYLATNQC